MTAADERTSLPDDAERTLAWSHEGSVLVEASAGTGKTTLLVRRALWLLLERGVPIDRLVALSFTEKAAGEMTGRLRQQLRETLRASALAELPALARFSSGGSASLARVRSAARAALDAFPRASISTIHAFASSILRLLPVEAGVDPNFKIVEEPAAAAVLRRVWHRFVRESCAPGAPRAGAWASVLRTARLADLESLGFQLAGYRTDLRTVEPIAGDESVPPPVRAWLTELQGEAERLLGAVGPRNRKPAAFLDAAKRAAGEMLRDGRSALPGLRASLRAAPSMASGWPKAWSEMDVERGRELWHSFRALQGALDEGPAREALALLKEFAVRGRATFRSEGLMTYDGLIALCRDLLRDRTDVRSRLKRRFDAILVDEVQDVDPMQLELLLFLAERPDDQAPRWQDVRLAPGKLLLVGDPKQSIYAFRHAELAAYRRVADLVRGQGAAEARLTASLRSRSPIIEAVNAAGRRMFAEAGEPAYLPLEPGPSSSSGSRPRIVRPRPAESESLAAAEGRAIAALAASFLATGRAPSDLAVLFPQRGPMPPVAEAMRKDGIPVLVEEEQWFFRRQEIVDLHNLLRLLDDPEDDLALAGTLRGPFVGVLDDGLAGWIDTVRRLRRASEPTRGFDALRAAAGRRGGAAANRTFAVLARVSSARPAVPAERWLEQLWTGLSVDAVASATSRPGSREAVAAFKRLSAALVTEHGLHRTLELYEAGLRAEEGRGESPVRPPTLARDPAARAVRLLTIHQAKGLEFPVVILAGLRAPGRPERPSETILRSDWTTGLTGVTLRGRGAREAVATLEGAFLENVYRRRALAQDRRVLYVALTRARDELVVVLPDPGKHRVSDHLTRHLEPVFAEAGELFVEESALPARCENEAPANEPSRDVPVVKRPRPVLREDTGRTPTEFDDRWPDERDDFPYPRSREVGRWIGEVCHRMLEHWDFRSGPEGIAEAVRRAGRSLRGPVRVPPGVIRKATELLEGFLASPAAARLREAEILGREVPLAASVSGRPMAARADLLVRLEGRLVVGDYKVASAPVVSPAVADAYRRLASLALGEEAAFALISITGGTISLRG